MDDQLLSPRPEDVHLDGPVGEEIDRVISARMTSAEARERIVPEAVEAFQRRVDDRLEPGRGLWQGEFWGKWMLSAVAAWRYSGREDLLEHIRESTSALLATRRSDGYIGTYHDSGFVVGDTWNVWCRKYTLWGLLDAYQALEDPRVLEAAAGLMDHLMTEVGPGHTDIVRTGNFCGLPSSSVLTPLLKLHGLTGEARYLEYAQYIVEQWSRFPGQPPDIVGHGLSGRPVHEWFPDAGAWTKAYEFISCVEGLLGLYRRTGEADYLQAARRIHRAIRDHERVITGGIGYHDKLEQAAFRPDGLNEPCDVVYWERLNLELLRLTGAAEYADEIERLAWNVLMAVVSRDGSWSLRRLSLTEPHLIAVLHCHLQHHHCCVANIPRGLVQLAEASVLSTAGEDGVAVGLFLPGTTRLRLASGLEVAVHTTTPYPVEGTVHLRIEPDRTAPFLLRLRIPPWSRRAAIRINDESIPTPPQAEGWTDLRRTWQPEDRVDVELDLDGRLLRLPGDPRYAAVARGPVVLARSTLLTSADGGEEAVHAPGIPLADETDAVRLEPIRPPAGVRMAFRAETGTGGTMALCDYASAGKDFAKPSPQMPWDQMVDNRTPHALRVWMEASDEDC